MCLLLFMKCCGLKWSSFSTLCVFSLDYKWRLCSKEHLTDMKPCQNTPIHIYHTHTKTNLLLLFSVIRFVWHVISRNTCVESLQFIWRVIFHSIAFISVHQRFHMNPVKLHMQVTCCPLVQSLYVNASHCISHLHCITI